jgi:tRNA(His) 5'-end guanylyltransferase
MARLASWSVVNYATAAYVWIDPDEVNEISMARLRFQPRLRKCGGCVCSCVCSASTVIKTRSTTTLEK